MWILAWAGSSLPEAGRAGVGPRSSLRNGFKSGWGEWVWAEEIVAVVGAQLGQVGPYSGAEEEALSPAKDSLLGAPLRLHHLHSSPAPGF